MGEGGLEVYEDDFQAPLLRVRAVGGRQGRWRPAGLGDAARGAAACLKHAVHSPLNTLVLSHLSPLQSAEAYYRSKAGLWLATDPVPVYLEKVRRLGTRRGNGGRYCTKQECRVGRGRPPIPCPHNPPPLSLPYAQQVEAVLLEEAGRVQGTMLPSSEEPLLRALVDTLLTRQASQVRATGGGAVPEGREKDTPTPLPTCANDVDTAPPLIVPRCFTPSTAAAGERGVRPARAAAAGG
jgi:hypothetical protein